MTGVLFVCTGNICRSPTAEGIFRKLVEERGLTDSFDIDSVGMIAYHVGEAPDRRTRQIAASHDVDLSKLRARQIEPADYERFDYLIAMDSGHERQLHQAAPEHLRGRIHLLMSFLGDPNRNEVEDPYYGSMDDFRITFESCMDGCAALLEHLTQRQ